VVTNAAAVPSEAMKGVTASINSSCSLSRSGVVLTRMLAEADGFVRYEVVLVGGKLPTGWVLLRKHFVGGCKDFGEVGGFDIALEHGDVWRVCSA